MALVSHNGSFGTRPGIPLGERCRSWLAWAQEGGCANDLWLDLAAKREKEHPEDALPIYQRQIEPTLDRKNNEAYREAVDFLRKVRGLMLRLGRESEFTDHLNRVRAKHKAKRNFIQLLGRATFEGKQG